MTLVRPRSSRIVGAITALLAATSASAESPTGFYVGAGVGSSNVSVLQNEELYFLPPAYFYPVGSYLEGEGDTASEVHFGYRVLRHLAVELGYLETGPGWDDTIDVPELGATYHNVVDFDLKATELTVAGVLPFGRVWEAYAKVGVAAWDADVAQTQVRLNDGTTVTRSINDSDTRSVFAVGIGASPRPAWHLRFEIQSFEITRDLVLVSNPTSIETMLFAGEFKLGAKQAE